MFQRDFDRRLCSTWLFMPDREDLGGERGYMLKSCDTTNWREAEIPCVYEQYAPELVGYQGVMWFRKTFAFEKTKDLVWLDFRGVNYSAQIWLNGKPVGSHWGGYLPFRFEISSYLQEGDNLLVVRVDAHRYPGMLPSAPFWRCHGGILRDVLMYETPRCTAEDVRVREEDAQLILTTTVRNYGDQPQTVTLRQGIDGKAWLEQEAEIAANGTATLTFTALSAGLARWSPSHPALHELQTELHCGDDVDTGATQFGIRKIEAKDGKILLDGKQLFLRGFNRHEDSPARMHATDLACAEQDFRMMKELGANFVRMCHYPHSEGELDLCDRLGLVVLDEIPLCATLVKYGAMDDETIQRNNLNATRQSADQALRALVDRDYNHPSVFFWSVGNETEESIPEICRINTQLLQRAKQLDPTRLITHVSEGRQWNKSFNQLSKLFVDDDVICVNSYRAIGFIGADLDEAAAEEVRKFWDARMAEFAVAYPGKPIVVTEFGYPTGRDFDGILDEEAQTKGIQCDLYGMNDRVAGWSIWHFADHEWQIKESLEPCHGTHLSPYGVFWRDRSPKQVVEFLREYMQTHPFPGE